jgi:hypothetical protein
VGAAETVVGVGGERVEGMSGFTSRFCLASSVSRLVALAP